ncbi:hypothetical protein [Stenotrophomonas panacihumi]|uniref:hypothetical protein n=1 Tax=Stenotrophomonas panacihumi TaxID=676599 RepID=UPI0011B1E8CC|nr:hypothetical protein [Stenotrophomonas panacihumi]
MAIVSAHAALALWLATAVHGLGRCDAVLAKAAAAVLPTVRLHVRAAALLGEAVSWRHAAMAPTK